MTRLLYKNSFILFIGTLVSGFGGYLYQLAMGRMLSLEDFGTLAALMSFFSFVLIPAGALTTVTTQIVAGLKANEKYGAIRAVAMRLTQLFAWIGVALFLFFLLLTPLVARFLKLHDSFPYIILSTAAIAGFLLAIWRGLLSGLQRFLDSSINGAVESFLKLLFALGLVLVTFGLIGAVAATVMASFLALVLLRWQMRDVLQWKEDPIALRPFLPLFSFVFVWTIAMTALMSIDLLFVKRFFSAEETGLYAAMNLMGKIILFVSTSIAGVLFPMATELFEAGNHDEHRQLMMKTLQLALFVAVVGVIFYSLFPSFFVTILFGRRYLPFVTYLPLFGVVALFLSIIHLLATYFLSIRRRRFLVILLVAVFCESVLIIFYHATIMQILTILMSVFGLLALTLLGLFFFGEKTISAVAPV